MAYDYISYLEGKSKRAQLAVPVVLDESYLDLPKGTACWLIDCPHCAGSVLVAKQEVASNGFRHGIFKDRSGQIPPHASKETIDTMLAANSIWGCGQPFHVDPGTGVVSATDFSDTIVSDIR